MEPFRAMIEFVQTQFCNSKTHARGDGHAVVLFPGLGTDHSYMTPLASHCERLGYTCHHWGRGRNTGPTGPILTWLRDLAGDVDDLIRGHPNKVTLIGWSLGGVYAREVAKAIPQRVRQVVTLGTPYLNVRESTNARWLYDIVSAGPNTLHPRLARQLETAPPVFTTSVYSRSDGIVAWQACRLPPGPLTENIEVHSSHLGLIWHPDVLRIVASCLRRMIATEWSAMARHPSAHRDVIAQSVGLTV